jgi:hypothetical protein
MGSQIFTSEKIREEAARHGFTTARTLAEACGINIKTCHQMLSGDAVDFRERTLTRFTEFFAGLKARRAERAK